MNFHPEISKILNDKMNCPICHESLEVNIADASLSCNRTLCYRTNHFRLRGRKSIEELSIIELIVNMNKDKIIYLEQNFIKNNICLTFAPKHNQIIIPNFNIDFANLDKLPNKLKLYLTLS